MKIIRTTDHKNIFTFYCLGCKHMHVVYAKGSGQAIEWDFNGDFVKPTFSPSLLLTWNEPSGSKVCHSIITDGTINYCGDCTHELAGQSIPLPNTEDYI